MIKGEKVILKLVCEEDLDELYKNISDLSNRGDFFGLTLTPQSIFKKRFLETGFWTEDFGRFLITDMNQLMIGSIYYFKTAPYSDALELGFIIFDKDSKGKGYMTEALSLMVNYLFNTKYMNRIQLKIAPEHESSIKVALKCGFQFDGTRKQVVYNHGKHLDLNEYFILREDWENMIKL